MSVITIALTPNTAQAIAKIGTEVSLHGQSYTVYSVEGFNYYAFQSEDGSLITLDTNMPEASWLRSPVALLLPIGTKIGDGFGREVYLSDLDSSLVEA